MKTSDALKSLGRAVVGLAILASFVLSAIGTISILLIGGYYQFAVATGVVLGFAAKPMWKQIQKLLM